jgi:hypothetical protein
MKHSAKTFAVGASVGAVVAIGLNLLPYWRSYQAYHGDGYEVIGFPFIFRRMGGFVGIYEFRPELLIADAAIALSFAALAGLVAVKASKIATRSGRGFPVVPRSDGRTAAE